MTSVDPSFAMMRKAVSLHQKGQILEAEQSYRDVLMANPQHADALRLLGGLYVQANKLEEAIDCFEKALRQQPQHPELLNNLGVTLFSRGRFDDASQHYQQAIEIEPDYYDAITNLGNLFYESGQWGDAIKWLERSTQLKPDVLRAHLYLGHAFRMQNKAVQAMAKYKRVLELDPLNTDALHNLGNMLREVGHTEEARAAYQRLVVLKPDDVTLRLNLGTLLRDVGKWQEAMEQFDWVFKTHPDSTDAIVNRASLLIEMNKPEDARATYQQALTLKPDSVDAKWGQALAALMMGRYAEGWALYESRFEYKSLRNAMPFKSAQWDGCPINGKRLLIWGEQGLGDVLQFIRYAELCKAKGSIIIVLCREPLVRLLEECPTIDKVVTTATESDFDFHVPVMSLPFIFGTTLETIPQNIPYLFISDEARTKWAPRFVGIKELKVGLVWAGNPRKGRIDAHITDRQRSVSLSVLKPLLEIKACRFYSLQKDEASDEIAANHLTGQMTDYMTDVDDLMDTAALIKNLDLVISVDTSVAHLAGGLGKPVWILSRFGGCWRWLQNQETSPWYPTARIFGQPEPSDWKGCINQVDVALQELLRVHQ